MFQFRVKGQRFCIGEADLARHPATLFYELHQSGQLDINYTTRDPQFVGVLLVYLRKGTLNVLFDELNREQQQQFLNDVAFYRIPGDLWSSWRVKEVEEAAPMVDESRSRIPDVQDISLVSCSHCGSVGLHRSNECVYVPPHVLPLLKQ